MLKYPKFLRKCKKAEKAISKRLANGESPESIDFMDYMPKSFILREEQVRFKHWVCCRFPCFSVEGRGFAAIERGLPERTGVEEPVAEELSFCEGLSWQSRLACAKSVFSQLVRETEANTMYSPVSLEIALGLLSEGTSGETLSQLQLFLGSLTYRNEVSRIMSWSDAVKIGNSLWCSDRYPLKSSFLTAASKYYSALVSNCDFTDLVASRVNEWCSERTNGMIPEIISDDQISPDTVLLLCNAIYFASEWINPCGTHSDVFHCADGTERVCADMLYSEESIYYETDTAIAFGKQYADGMEFIGILPADGKTIDDIDLYKLLSSRSFSYIVDAYMPKLNYDYSAKSLVDILRFLGVTNIFDDNKADFRLLTEASSEVVVSDIIQKCRIELDEYGTKAAAVTEIECEDLGGALDFEPDNRERKVVKLNRPFYYMIVYDELKQVFFIGSVSSV